MCENVIPVFQDFEQCKRLPSETVWSAFNEYSKQTQPLPQDEFANTIELYAIFLFGLVFSLILYFRVLASVKKQKKFVAFFGDELQELYPLYRVKIFGWCAFYTICLKRNLATRRGRSFNPRRD